MLSQNQTYTGSSSVIVARYQCSSDKSRCLGFPPKWMEACHCWDRAHHKVKGLNTLRPRQNGRHFADDIFKCILLNENVWILIEISLKFVPKGPINNISALVQIMAWRWSGYKPLSEPMMDRSLTHICVTLLQWVKSLPPWELLS